MFGLEDPRRPKPNREPVVVEAFGKIEAEEAEKAAERDAEFVVETVRGTGNADKA